MHNVYNTSKMVVCHLISLLIKIKIEMVVIIHLCWNISVARLKGKQNLTIGEQLCGTAYNQALGILIVLRLLKQATVDQC